MKYSEAFAQVLVDHGVNVMFGVLGDANMHIGDAFARSEATTRFIATAHESGAVLMAAGFASRSGKVGAATVTHGAITNCVGALFEATRGHYPLLVVTGDTDREDVDNLQNLPHHDIVVPTGAGIVDARAPNTVFADVGKAIHDAMTRRRPVVLNLPSSFQTASCDPEPYRPVRVSEPTVAPARQDIENAAAVVAGCSRPVILAGHGATFAGAADALTALARRIGAPLATTLKASGLFRGEPYSLGICGTLSSAPATATIANSDCIIAFGASLGPLTTLKGELLAKKRLVQVDHDPTAIGRYHSVDVGVVGDAEESATALTSLLDEIDVPTVHYRSAALLRDLERWRIDDLAERSNCAGLDIRDALCRIDALLPRERTLTIDAGRFAHEALRNVTVSHPSHYIHALNIAQVGLSLGCGVGGAVAAPDNPTAVLIGDGGFMLGGINEFNTAVRNELDLIVFVMNDRAYGAEYYRFVEESLDCRLVTFDWPDFASVATSLGGLGLTVRQASDFDYVEQQIRDRRRPILVDVVLDRDDIPDPGIH
jgi:thiamine pyrophosphate-dependent acetolactate synthase large subunit-like protein